MLGVNVQAIANRFNINVLRFLPKSFDKFLLKLYGKRDLVGIEIGAYLGEHAAYLLKQKKIKFMYLIDEYKIHNDAGHYTLDMKKIEKKAKRNLSPFTRKFKLIKENSDAAHSKFKKESMDFIYIDGGHSYEQVKKDIENYFPLVKKGGVIGGHDFTNLFINRGPVQNGVVKAVLEFIKKKGYSTDLYVDFYDWWIIK